MKKTFTGWLKWLRSIEYLMYRIVNDQFENEKK